MKPDISPATAEVHRIRRSSTPFDRRSSQEARRFSAPVWSRPAPRIMVAMIAITALPEKPENSSLAGTSPGHAERDQHHQRGGVAADALEHEHGHGEHDQAEHQHHVAGQDQVGAHVAAQVLRRRYSRSQTPWPSFWPAGLEMRLPPPLRPRHGAARTGGVVAAAARRRARRASARRSAPSRWPGAAGRPGAACRTAGATKAGLHQPALVVPLLVPGIGEVDRAPRRATPSAISSRSTSTASCWYRRTLPRLARPPAR